MSDLSVKNKIIVIDPTSAFNGLQGKIVKTRVNVLSKNQIYQIKFKNRHMNMWWLTGDKLEKIA